MFCRGCLLLRLPGRWLLGHLVDPSPAGPLAASLGPRWLSGRRGVLLVRAIAGSLICGGTSRFANLIPPGVLGRRGARATVRRAVRVVRADEGVAP